ncbi:hypothetical protein M2323_004651 [Rhodoblastus acidophilus]|uniref:hypothetical protein n=1 Tax=Rhodoblastus acidophilus TaxID=1074 RepID=UPI0022254DC6|nr:hypothetical protein [Rhodoblastus acidophilus]MCW2286655.1 hypothetical protein [Rhodoblastus acidophilus]MCW2335699.1 hypothetical protein [Rhodoblastus acidophilus]
MTFKVGDKVIAVSNEGDCDVVVGNTYTVVDVDYDGDLHVEDENGKGYFQLKNRWKSAEPERYVVVDPSLGYIEETLFDTYEAAEAAAKESLEGCDEGITYIAKVIASVAPKTELVVTKL